MKKSLLYCGIVVIFLSCSIQKVQAGILFSDTFDTDTTANYINPFSTMRLSYAAPERAIRYSGPEGGIWYYNQLSGVYNGTISAKVKLEKLGTLDGNGNGLGACVGLRVNPSGSPGHWGVWGGLNTRSYTKYAIIGDGYVDTYVGIPYSYSEGQTYDLKLEVAGSHATLYINGSKVLETNGITQPLSGLGATAVLVQGGASSSVPSSFLIDNWQVTSDTTPPTKQKPVIIGYDLTTDSAHTLSPAAYSHCTHVIGTPVDVNSKYINKYLQNMIPEPSKYVETVKIGNPDRKVLICLTAGLPPEGGKEFTKICSDSGMREKLIESVCNEINKYGFDGVDVDWEYPDSDSGVKAFRDFMYELHNSLPSDKLITFAISGFKSDCYSLEEMADITDYCILMGYDYSDKGPLGPWEFPWAKLPWILPQPNVKEHLEKVAEKYPVNHIVLALPFYCRWGWNDPDTLSWSDFASPQREAIKTIKLDAQFLEKQYSFTIGQKTITTWVNDPSCLFEKSRSALFGNQIRGRNIGGVGAWQLRLDSDDAELITALEIATGRGASQQVNGIAMSIVLNSHADLHLYDPLGNHVGVNYTANKIEQNILGATFRILNGDGNEVPYDGNAPDEGLQQVIGVPILDPGNYRIELFGTSNGPFHLAINGVQDGINVTGNTYEGQITSGKRIIADLTADANEDTITLSYEPLNIVPVANAGSAQTVYAWIDGIAEVNLDGSGSYDDDNDMLTYKWSWSIDGNDYDANGVKPTIELPVGQHVISLIVNDGTVDSEPNEVVITVLDNTPPEFSLSVKPNVLWPPNHKMVKVAPSWTVTDNCDKSPAISLVKITMSEGDVTNTFDPVYDVNVVDGKTTGDIQIASDGSIYLRAERAGSGPGRLYTITYKAVDDSGNATIKSAIVTVPHDQR